MRRHSSRRISLPCSRPRKRFRNWNQKKGESETYLADLNTQLDDLRSSLEKLQNDYDAKQEELTQLQSDLEDAKADKRSSMKR